MDRRNGVKKASFTRLGAARGRVGCARHAQILAGADIVAVHPRAPHRRVVPDPGHFQGESTDTVIAPAPLGSMGTRIAKIAALAPENRPLDLYAALAEVAR